LECRLLARLGALVLVLGVVSLPLGASAQEPPAAASMESAREHMERGQELFTSSRFVEAAEEFQLAYEAQAFSAFLFNAGVCYERHDDPARAADFFARYLDRDPDANDARDVRARIELLRTTAANRQTTASTATTTTTTSTDVDAGVPPSADAGVPTTTQTTTAPDAGAPPAVDAGAAVPTVATTTSTATVLTADDDPPPAPTAVPEDFKSLLSIRTNPAGAQVTLRQGERVISAGPSPFAFTVEQGDYRVVVEHPDYRRIETPVRVRPGKVYLVIVEMSQGEFLGYLRVVTDVPGAHVFLDDHDAGSVGTTPYQNAIATGTHRLWVERPGYRAIERTVEVGVGEDVLVRTDLTRVDEGRIRVVSNVPGSQVYVDDHLVGTVPYEGDASAGPHDVRVEADDMKDWETQLTVRAGQVTPIRVRLKPAVGRGGAWTTAVIGALLVGGGVGMAVYSEDLRTELDTERAAGRLTSNDSRLSTGFWVTVGADVAFGLGAALGLLSIYYFLRDPLPDSEATVLEPRDWAFAPYFDPSTREGGGTMRWSF
jgi:hypothetical protein